MSQSHLIVQRLAAILAKACLSSIPFVALAFDLGQAAVDLTNASMLSKFLDDLGSRLELLECGDKDRLLGNPIHQIAALGALRVLISESDARIASALARAVERLSRPEAPLEQRAECARVLGELSEPILHALQTYYRFEQKTLLDVETTLTKRIPEECRQEARSLLGIILHQSMPLLSWRSVVTSLMGLGLITPTFDAGIIGEPDEALTVAPLTPLGRRVLNLALSSRMSQTSGDLL